MMARRHDFSKWPLNGIAIQLDSVPVKIDDPMATLPADKTVNGITAHIEKGVWNELSHYLEIKVTYKRGTYSGDWTEGAQGLAGIKPQVVRNAGQRVNVNCNASITGDTVTATYAIMMGTVAVGTAQPMPAIESIIFDFPTGVSTVAVPVEFHDLPLP
jgi:hypothetical protein